MRVVVILATLGCLLALCHAESEDASREVTFTNSSGQEEVYNSDDFHCHRVGRKFHTPDNTAAATGGPVKYYSDSRCKVFETFDTIGKGAPFKMKTPIKAYRAIDPAKISAV
ncbi:hypothetical protein GGI01_003334 [Coemansia sp. RSA 376]|nr:hypothetical protein H4S04_001652 [Coemansia sp. S16]KAJ2068106.1 hypothetical protein GGI08_001042 [Coemansia sp. S2]KAJ2071204.1 hypothetical protein GGH13_003515 [Coemansia sp. S155-1]KAJ2259926.1 hypothetical protein GGI01_003334 [Coemansia sp. RSA 376]KAJ2340164.1 hypothetical protein GGH92_006392 [Coemansia sp. RSA 2673]KAJ2462239.1 hypothetical protein GGI03_004600 [Coemansia sp. RSA 2337]